MRERGVLLHISCLPSPYGIGTMGQSAFDFIDLLKQTNQQYWQVLPIGPTSYGDSPYQTFSSFAGNPYFIDFDQLVAMNLLNKEDLKDILVSDNHHVDYYYQYCMRYEILKIAFRNWNTQFDSLSFNTFKSDNNFWLNDYALFMSLKKDNNGKCWYEWAKPYRQRNQFAINEFINSNREEIEFWKFIQYLFYKQWFELKEYANNQGIKIIGDIPIYVAMDSSDVWADPKSWKLDEDLLPKVVSGVPPDCFSETGQLWGNPIYDYDYMKNNGYSWWINRIKKNSELFDVIRIDHFRGFEAFYEIPSKDYTAEFGKWVKGPGIELFQAIENNLGKLNIIAEDLGIITKEVKELLNETGFPGMKILQFAFDSDLTNEYLPHNYKSNCVAYPGTHDNMTLKQWVDSLDEKKLAKVFNYMKIRNKLSNDQLIDILINDLMKSKANLVIIPFVDYLKLGGMARFNTPSTLGNNWNYRFTKEQVNNTIFEYMNSFNR